MNRIFRKKPILLGLLLIVLVAWIWVYFFSEDNRFAAKISPNIETIPISKIAPAFDPQNPNFIESGEIYWIGDLNLMLRECFPHEMWILSVLAKSSQVMFEFGTFRGKTAYLLARNAPENAKVYTITLPPAYDKIHSQEEDNVFFEKAALFESKVAPSFYKNTPVEHKIVQLFGDSREFDESELAGKVDLIFIDGGHTFSCVKSDTIKALRMAKPDTSCILWHDFDPGMTDTFNFLNQLGNILNIKHINHTRFLIAKGLTKERLNEVCNKIEALKP